MRVQTMLIAGAAAPAVAGLGYAVLTGYLMSKVKPVPITVLTDLDGEAGLQANDDADDGYGDVFQGPGRPVEALPVRELEPVAV